MTLRRLAFVVPLAVVAVGVCDHAVASYGPREILDARKRLYATTYRWTDQHQVVRVTTVDAHAREQERMVELWERRYGDGGRKLLLVFLSPDNVRGTSVLSQQRASGAPERWLYLPRQKRARRFAGQMKDEGLMGTDMTAAEIDLMHESIGWTATEVRPVLRGTDEIDGVEAYGLEVVRAKGYERIMLWVGTGDLVLRRLELFGAETTALKRIRQSDVRFIGAVPVASRTEVETPGAGTRSVFEVVQAEFDRGFPDDVFSLPLLASPSKE